MPRAKKTTDQIEEDTAPLPVGVPVREVAKPWPFLYSVTGDGLVMNVPARKRSAAPAPAPAAAAPRAKRAAAATASSTEGRRIAGTRY